MPDVGIRCRPTSPNGGRNWSRPATDLGGLSANGDHISPEHPFPSPHQVRKQLAPEGFALTERLGLPQYMNADWMGRECST
jgi:FO synthase